MNKWKYIRRAGHGGWLIAVLLGCAWALRLQWEMHPWPQGDEGSWMAVASQWARGEGYTTRWLEYHWLEPYRLPRPDDFRYPALTTLLGMAFKFFGMSYGVALATVAGVFLAMLVVLHAATRRFFGRAAAGWALPVAAFSLLQLQWNARVYTEGLFAFMLLAVLVAAHRVAVRHVSMGACIGLGLALGGLYLTRPNGLLFAAGVPALLGAGVWSSQRRVAAFGIAHLGVGAGFLLVAGPWLYRTYALFGNPFHIAGSAGLMRETLGDSPAQQAGRFMQQHDLAYFAQRIIDGAGELATNLHQFEHGLEVLPMLLALGHSGHAAVRVYRRRRATPVQATQLFFFLPGCALTVLACAYAAKNSWAGSRYLAPLLPWVYAYGVAWLPLLLRQSIRMPWRRLATPMLLAALLAPVAGPHRFFIRHASRLGEVETARIEQADHMRELNARVKPGSPYYASYFGQMNFASDRLCVGLQELHHVDGLPKAEAAFRPEVLVKALRPELAAAEAPDMALALERLAGLGCRLDTLGRTGAALYLRVVRESAADSSRGTLKPVQKR